MAFIVLQDLQSALALNSFDLQHYLSGSVHYLLGAKALVVFAPAMVGFVRSRRRWMIVPLWALASLGAFGALISGSRGVYAPLAVLFVVSVLRLARNGRWRTRLMIGATLMIVVIVGVDRVLPYHPVTEALTSKASVQMQEASVSEAGAFTQRLRYWSQGMAMVRAHPLGVGLGGFRSVIHAFQRFPMVWSSSPHNVFVETAATVGWPGLILLVALLIGAFVRSWRSDQWPWALSLLGIWFTLSVDVTADYPLILSMAFAVVGACLGPVKPATVGLRRRPEAAMAEWLTTVLPVLVLVAGVGLTIWWYAPCEGTACAITRWRGIEYKVAAAAKDMPPADRDSFLRRAERLYPASLWVLNLEEAYAPTLAQKLSLARSIATRFPLQSWKNYLTWAHLALQAEDPAQARQAVERGLDVFGPDSHRYAELRTDPAGYAQWLAEAKAILRQTGGATGP